MKKCFLCLILCAAVLCACVLPASAYYNTGSWAQEAVSAMYSLGFLPTSLNNADMSANISRGQMCQMAAAVYNNLLGTPDVGPDSTDHFDDTDDPTINYAYEQGIVSGYGDGRFAPNDPLTRQDFFKITYNMLATAYWDPNTVTLASLDGFRDASALSDYAVTPTKAMVAIGVVQGDGSNLNPKSYASRQEAIVMFFRAYQYMVSWMNARTEANKSVQIYAKGYYNISTWAIREVKEMDDNGMIPASLDGCNMSRSITRAEMCSIAVRAYEKATGNSYSPDRTDHFTDTSDADVNAAYELKIVGGYGDGRFGPNDSLTREQFFRIMANFMQVLEYPRDDSRAASLDRFKDGGKVSDWAKAPTRLLMYIGAVSGDGTNVYPQNAASVQEAIVVFLRCYKFTVAWKQAHPDGVDDEQPSMMSDLVAYARSFEGCPYVYGGNSPSGFDCSGFVLYVYKHFGYSFSRGAQEQYQDGMHVGMDDLLAGDLVFFSGNGYNITHVGLYIGDGYFIHASNPTRGVVIDTLYSGYYNTHFWGGCRIVTE